MAGSGVVVSHADATTPSVGSIFDGKSFFVSQRVPSRNLYIDKIRANGGRLIKVESGADYRIADHLRKDTAPNCISYTFIDAALRDSALPDPNDHPAGPKTGTVRTIGSTTVAPKGTRTVFTAQDDRDLWLWVQDSLKSGKGTAKGNEIYKQLEAVNPRHTFQAWRDRYIKKLMDRPPDGVLKEHARDQAANEEQPNGHRDEVTAQNGEEIETREQQPREENDRDNQQRQLPPRDMGPIETAQRSKMGAPELEDLEDLLMHAPDIQKLDHDGFEASWVQWAAQHPPNTPAEYRDFYNECVLPVYRERQKSNQLREATRRHREEQSIYMREGSQNGQSIGHQVETEPREQNSRSIPSPNPQKRKRDVPTPLPKTYGKKRARQDNSDIFAPEDEEEQQPRSGPEMSHVVSEDALPTSEVNCAARGQLIAEAHVEEILPTSEANRAAREQLTIEAEKGIREEQGHETSTPPRSPTNAQAETIDDDDPGSAGNAEILTKWSTGLFADKRARAHLRPVKSRSLSPELQDGDQGDALTEANLASQQQQHKAQLMRGVDLPEDDETVDLSAYANTLTKLLKSQLGKAQSKQPEERANVAGRLMGAPEKAEDVSEIGSERDISEDEMPNDVNIDEAFTQNADWPMSPQKRSEPVITHQQQSYAIETQVQYPDLEQQGQSQELQHQEEVEDEGSSQLFENLRPTAPERPIWRDEDMHFSSQADVEDAVEDAVEADEATTPTQPKMDSRLDDADGPPASFKNENARDNDGEDDHNQVMDDEDYLIVPPPEEGFSEDEEMEAEQVNIKPDVQSPRQMASHRQTQGGRTDEPIEISSQESSDSSSEPEEYESQRGKKIANTQAILNAETQQPDLDVPLPPDSDEEPELPSYPPVNPRESRPSFVLPRGLEQPQEEERPLTQLFPPGGLFAKPSTRPSAANNGPRRSTIHRQPLPLPNAPKPTPPAAKPVPRTKRTSTSKPAAVSREDESLDAFIARLTRASHPQPTIVRALRMTSMRKPIAEMVVYLLKNGRPLPQDVREIWTEEEDAVAKGGDSSAINQLVEGTDEKAGKGWDEYENRLEFLGEWGEG